MWGLPTAAIPATHSPSLLWPLALSPCDLYAPSFPAKPNNSKCCLYDISCIQIPGTRRGPHWPNQPPAAPSSPTLHWPESSEFPPVQQGRKHDTCLQPAIACRHSVQRSSDTSYPRACHKPQKHTYIGLPSPHAHHSVSILPPTLS